MGLTNLVLTAVLLVSLGPQFRLIQTETLIGSSLAEDCGSIVNAGYTCADPSWTMYEDAFVWCCAPGTVGLALGDGHCEPASLTYSSGDYATTVSSHSQASFGEFCTGHSLIHTFPSRLPNRIQPLLQRIGRVERCRQGSPPPELLPRRVEQLRRQLLPLLRDKRGQVRVQGRVLLRQRRALLVLLLNITSLSLWEGSSSQRHSLRLLFCSSQLSFQSFLCISDSRFL